MNKNISKTCMCSICKVFYINQDGIDNCCRDCEKKLVKEFKPLIVGFMETHPYATVMDLLNSDVIKAPKEYNIGPGEFKNLILNVCGVGGPLTYDVNTSEKQKSEGSALTRDLEEMKTSHGKDVVSGTSYWHSTKKNR